MTDRYRTCSTLFHAAAAAAMAAILAVTAVPAAADLVKALDRYTVSFTTERKMASNFRSADMYDQASGLQPGDATDIVLNLKNENSSTVDWYLTNKVLRSLEDTRDAEDLADGAYTYVLSFENAKTGTSKTLFSSDTVGGEESGAAGEGLHEATAGLEDWVYLDTFASDEGGTLTLHIALDGETQGNSYQDTLAELEMNFAVEVNNVTDKPGSDPGRSSSRASSSTSSRHTTVVTTGDDTNPVPYLVMLWASGGMVLFLAVSSLREYRRERGGHAGR